MAGVVRGKVKSCIKRTLCLEIKGRGGREGEGGRERERERREREREREREKQGDRAGEKKDTHTDRQRKREKDQIEELKMLEEVLRARDKRTGEKKGRLPRDAVI